MHDKKHIRDFSPGSTYTGTRFDDFLASIRWNGAMAGSWRICHPSAHTEIVEYPAEGVRRSEGWTMEQHQRPSGVP